MSVIVTRKAYFHSADFDGKCSGAIINHFIKGVEFYPINYGEDFPWDDIEADDIIFMVDFCLQPFDQMIKLLNRVGFANLTWIDHHITAINDYEQSGVLINGKRDVDKAGCELTWEWFNGEERDMPEFIRLLGRYDIWDHSNPRTLPFQYGMGGFDNTEPDAIVWKQLFHGQLDTLDICNTGGDIQRYIKNENKMYCNAAFETELDGLKCIALNRMFTGSLLFESIWDSTKYDAMLVFGWRNGMWTVSLYTDKEGVDVSKTCKKFGGGGHKGAAGFSCDELPFKL